MAENLDTPENAPCPYCGAANPLDSEFCGACYKKLHLPEEIRAEARARKLLAGARAPLRAAPGPAAGQEAPAFRLWARAAVIAALFFFYTRWLVHEKYFSALDYVNLAFHEAGHVVLGFLPKFVMMAAGTLFQVLVPAVCLAHLLRRGANLGWQLCLFWIGQNLLNVSIYAGDAIKQELPLVGGGVHDWTYLLTELGLIAQPQAVQKFIFFCGSAVIFWSFWLIGRDALSREPIELGNHL